MIKPVEPPARPSEDTGWLNPPLLLADGHYAICGHADVARALKDLRFTSILAEATPSKGESSCPWLRLSRFFRTNPPASSSLHQVRNLVKKSFIFYENGEYERLQRPIKKIFLKRLPSVQENLALAAQEHLLKAAGNTACDWGKDVIRPYIASNVKILFDYPEDLKLDFYELFSNQAMDEIFGINPAAGHESANFVLALDFIGKCLASPNLHKTKGLIAEISSLSAAPSCFTKEEIIGNILFMLIAASFSAPRTLAASLRTLMKRPDLLKQLRENPALVPSAVQELLRTHPPITRIQRQIGEELFIHGVVLKKGDWVYIDLLSGNMDPLVFESPEEILFTRSSYPHFSFGFGPHYCLGAPMARMQIEVFLKAFVKESLHASFEAAATEGIHPQSGNP